MENNKSLSEIITKYVETDIHECISRYLLRTEQ